MTMLVTGGAGFIGANFVHHWRRRRPDDAIVVLDALTYAGNPANLAALRNDPKVIFVHGDICDEPLVGDLFVKHDVSTVVHFAAESHVDRSIHSSKAFIRTNVDGTHTLLESARQAWKGKTAGRRFHHISTDEVYGSLGPKDPAFTETTPYDPRSPYAASKAASDMLVRAYAYTHGLPVTISNCSNNYGPYQFPEKLIPLMLLNAVSGRRLPVYGDGMNVRDWLHVEDHCAAIACILEAGKLGETYNVGGGNEVINLDLVRLLCREVDARFERDASLARRFPEAPSAKGGRSDDLIEFVQDRPGHDRRYAICSDKLARECGFRAGIGFEQGLAETVDWYLANEAWWKPIQSGEYRNWIALQYGADSEAS